MPETEPRRGVVATFLALTTPAPPPVSVKLPPNPRTGKKRRQYREREFCGTYVRQLSQCRKYQLRVWCSLPFESDPYRGFPAHCGLFDTAHDGRVALRELSRLVPDGYTPLDIWKAVRVLQDRGVIPTGRQGAILPLWVRRVGDQFVAHCTRRGERWETAKHATPDAAHLELWERIVAAGSITK